MAYDVTRNLGPGTSGSYSYTSVGNAEDLSDILLNIDPLKTKLLSSFGTAQPAIATSYEWFTERLRPPQDNAHYEKEEYSFNEIDSQEGLRNWIQHFQNTGFVTDTQTRIKKAFRRGTSEFNAAVDHAIRGQGDDIEYMIISSASGHGETPGSIPARSGGIPYFMRLNELAATVTTSDNTIKLGTVSASNPVDLKTGDFVYFTAATMPTGLVANRPYYIRLTTAGQTLKNIFTLHPELEDAINNTNTVNLTTAGTDVVMVRRNVVSMAGATDTWTLDDLNTVMEMVKRRGGHADQAYMSLANKRAFSKLINAEIQPQRDPAKAPSLSDAATIYHSDFGNVEAHAHFLYPNSRIDILDMQYWDIKYLTKTHEVGNLPKTGTYEKFVVEADLGVYAAAPQASGSLIDISL